MLGDEIQAALPVFRAQAESLMTDACIVSRGGEPVFNPGTGTYETPSTPVYEGKCRLQSVRAQAANPEAGGAVFTVERVELQLPFGVTFQVGDVAVFTASLLSPDLPGTTYRITGLGRKSHATAQRFNVEVVSGGS